ncbi:esterase-like activity of phytase family protein [Klenkia brasiliensis]|uniref:Esterase-like activity of phytase n=1 Tax=Klenkia brasiliensis TaxID=333142 RepID=A0A1G7ZR07_9ACTN|nr:esterase-like activity of phytase family protein [Klenkia brasiliensis]SDH11109.1 hypothetical protein SAMN05660324_4329 [Klenkia brasiliensis]
MLEDGERLPEARTPRSRALSRLPVAAVLCTAVLAGPFLPGAFLSGGVPQRGVDTAAAQEGAAALYGDPQQPCSVTDTRLPEISGLAVAGSTTLVMNDGGDAVTVYELDAGCAVTGVRTAPVDPYDPEDMALAADGTVWLADTGDNRLSRSTVALIALAPDGSAPVYRLSYPDGPRDAEALLLAPDGTPYVVTKDVLGHSEVYRPAQALDAASTVPLTRVADLAFTLTGTEGGPVGRAGQLMVTGGAVSPDGAALVLRTYTDAYVWPLAGSDVPAALAGPPTVVPLPASPQGEAIAFAADARSLVVTGEGLPAAVTVLPAVGALAPAAATEPADGAGAPAAADGSPLSPWSAGAIAAIAAAVLVAGVSRIRRR